MPQLDIKAKLDWADETQIAEFRGMDVQSLRSERARGLGPPYKKIGRKIFYPLADFKKFIDDNTRAAKPARTMIVGNRSKARA